MHSIRVHACNEAADHATLGIQPLKDVQRPTRWRKMHKGLVGKVIDRTGQWLASGVMQSSRPADGVALQFGKEAELGGRQAVVKRVSRCCHSDKNLQQVDR